MKATDHLILSLFFISFSTFDIQQHRDNKNLQLLHLQGPNNKTHRSQALRPLHGLESTRRASRESSGGFDALKWSHQHEPIDVVKYNRGLQLGLGLFQVNWRTFHTRTPCQWRSLSDRWPTWAPSIERITEPNILRAHWNSHVCPISTVTVPKDLWQRIVLN